MAMQVEDMSVLIVDDDPVTRMVHELSLRHFGFRKFTTAENGMQAIQLCESSAHYDIITMDFSMPFMNGIEATKILREKGVNARIIGVSADGDPALGEKFMEAGANRFCTKPLDADKIATFFNNM